MAATTANYSGPIVMTSSQSELMPNYMASSAVSSKYPIQSVLDHSGNPVVFSIGTNQELWVVYRDSLSPTGWVQQDIASGLGAVLTVGVVQAATGEFTIAIAVAASGSQTADSLAMAGIEDSRSRMGLRFFL